MFDKNKKYLMKRRRYGWGLLPVTWTAALVIGFQIAIIFAAATFLPAKPELPTVAELIVFLVIALLAIGTVVLFGIVSGPALRWRWDRKTNDNPDEDF